MALNHDKYIEDAIRAVQETKRPPEIDFTIHTLEDGTEVSTLERVCKGTYNIPFNSLNLFIMPLLYYIVSESFSAMLSAACCADISDLQSFPFIDN